MARWRATAIQRVPELREAIASADSVMALWIDLWRSFEKAYEQKPPDESLIGRIYSFAHWCGQAPRGPDAGHDPLSAAVVSFYEQIPTFHPARDDMPRWFRYEEVLNNRQVFSYLIGEAPFRDLVEYMRKNRSRYVPRAGSPTID